ncbi:MAG: hypothetical protein KAR06_10880, partial [Deltaproteobacteria bacterium]|nr:hypothetical protein [Deltaproteobacteria bacterium]
AISPGLTGQLDHKQEPSFTEACYFCHAPLNEQSQYISTVDGYEKNPKYIRSIEGEGVTCAACHLRNGSVYGPSTNSVFKDSAFCGACHQLPDGYVLNGKLLVNTYNEWKESPYPEKNISCQSCHMPDKRHLFRGIHDKEMTRSALNITSALSSTSGIATSSLTIENTGAGHYFPTYITPLIVIEAYVETTEGKEKIKTWQVGRIANLALTEEAMDTRLKPMEKRELTFETKLPNKPFKIIFEAWVYPDEFYNRFYRSLLKSGSYKNRALIEKALHDTENSPYMLFKEVITVNNIL